MAGLKKTVKKMGRDIEGSAKLFADPNPAEHIKFHDPTRHANEAASHLESAFTPEVPELEEETIIPIPDESRAALEARRRRAKSSRTGRDSTILTEGLGG